MSVFDLKPLSPKTIDDLKIKPDQLWEIKIDENIFGPFETLQLKHYSKENRATMLRALVSNMSIDSWRPFYEVREFITESHYSGPYWLLAHGQKSSPLAKTEIAKRIELGTITRHDEISEDDGRHWHRIANHPEFENYFTTGTSLPEVPQEASFQKAKIQVLEQLEAKREQADEKDHLAGFTHASLVTKEKTRTVKVKVDEIRTPNHSLQNSFWENHKVHFLMASPVLALFVYFTYLKPAPVHEVVEVSEPVEKEQKAPIKRAKKDSWTRSPANFDNNSYDRSGVTQQPSMEDNYPTVIETHQDEQNYPDPDKEADQVAEIEDQEEKTENSLLDQQQPNRDPAQDGGESLDATMNNETMEMPNPAVDMPVVEEASDF